MAEGRRGATTEHIRNVAVANILESGSRAFSLNAVAAEAFVSVGAVYERWQNKSDALLDLTSACIAPELAVLLTSLEATDFEAQQHVLINDPQALRAQQLLVELLFASREDPTLRERTAELVAEYVLALQLPFGKGPLAEALAMWSASTLLGNALLRLGNAQVPDISAEVSIGLMRAARYEIGGTLTPVADDVPGLTPLVPQGNSLDATGARLRDAARTVLSTADLNSTREVAASAGVTTGALYRRFGSKSDLINEVLIDELQPTRYAWANQLITTWREAGSTDDVADVFAEQFITSLSNEAQVNMLLQITSQARSDEAVRKMLVGQVENVAKTRESMFAAIQLAGVMEPFTTPPGQAWLLQATPTGARMLRSNGFGPSDEHIVLAIRAIAAAFIATIVN